MQGGAGSPERRDRLFLLAIISLAFLVRLVHVLQLQHAPTFAHETMDPGYNARWAQAIAAGQAFAEGPYFRAPLYAWFLGALFKLTGGSYLAARLIQMAVGAASCGLTFWIGRQVFPRWVAAAAGIVAAIYWPLVYFDGELLDPVLAIFLNLLAIAGLLRWARAPSLRAAVLPGLAIGLSALARPNILLFAPFAALWMWISAGEKRTRLASTAVFLCAVAIPVAAVTLRNAARGDAVVIASQGGVNFYIGNNPQANGTDVMLPGVRATIEGIYDESHTLAEQKLGRKLKPSESSAYYFREGLHFFQSDPGAAFGLLARKVGFFFARREVTNERNIYFILDHYARLAKALPIGFWLIGPLGLAGLVACWPRRRELFPLWGYVLTTVAGVALFFVTARFRLPAVPVLILLSAYALATAREAMRGKQWKIIGAQAGAVAIGVMLLLGGPPGSSRSEPKALTDMAMALKDQGRPREAAEMLEQAIRADPSYVEAYAALGQLYQARREPERAVAAYQRALTVDPQNVAVMNNLGALLLSTNHTAEGIAVLQRSVAIDPSHWEAQVNLAKGYSILRRFPETVAAYEKALAVHPDLPDAWVRLAWLHATIDDPAVLDCAKARQAAEKAVALTQRQDHRALNALAAAQARCGEFDAAIATAEQALAIAKAKGDAREAARIGQLQDSYRQGRAPLIGVEPGAPPGRTE